MWYGDKKIAKEMTKEQLEYKFECGLQYLNIGSSALAGNGFKHKEIIKKKEPQWPVLMNLFTVEGFEYLNLSKCNQNKNDMELIAYSLLNNPFGTSQIRVLNLSRNLIMKEGAKTLA